MINSISSSALLLLFILFQFPCNQKRIKKILELKNSKIEETFRIRTLAHFLKKKQPGIWKTEKNCFFNELLFINKWTYALSSYLYQTAQTGKDYSVFKQVLHIEALRETYLDSLLIVKLRARGCYISAKKKFLLN